MARAKYTYTIEDGFIAIIDQDCGMSVTNDIENVIAEIEKKENIHWIDYKIIYQDTEYIWDGWDNGFITLNENSKEDAKKAYNSWLAKFSA